MLSYAELYDVSIATYFPVLAIVVGYQPLRI